MNNRHQSGFGAIGAVVVLVLLAVLAATVVRLSSGSQASLAQDVQAARAQSAVRAGIDWGLFQVLKGTWVGCTAAQTQTLDLRSDTGMRVTVTCTGQSYAEGETSPGVTRTVRVYRLQAVACNGSSGTCPDNAAAAGAQYVERARSVTVTD
jgi:MSHA biogenesis protein MshP